MKKETKMRIGVNIWTIYGFEPGSLDIEILSLIHEMGYKGIELVLDEGNYTARKLSSNKDELWDILDSWGIKIPSVASGLFWKYNLGSPDLKMRENGLKVVKEGCKTANEFGAEVLLVVAGIQEQGRAYDKLYQTSLASMKKGAEYAKEYGITLAVENVWSKFLYSPLEFRRFIDDVGSEHVKAYLDVGNLLVMGYPENWINSLKGEIASVHVKDFDIDDGSIRGFRVCGRGDVDWDLVIKTLKEVGYDGYLTVETPPSFLGIDVPSYPNDGLEAAKASIDGIKKYL